MSVQLPLPAGWARQFTSMPDPRDRLDALGHAKLSARTEIRKVLTTLIDQFGVEPREIDRAMDHVDDRSATSYGTSRSATGTRSGA